MSHNEAAPGAGSAPKVRPAGRLSLSNRRLPFKLIAILLVPVVTALAFAGLRVQSSYTTWKAAQDAVKTAQIVEAATEVAQDLDEERDSSLPYLIKGDTKNPVVTEAQAKSNAAISNFQALAANAPNVGHLQDRVKTANAELKGLTDLRNGTYQTYDTQTEEGYSHLLSALQALDNELVVGNGSSINSDARSIYAITLTKDAMSVDRAIGLHMLLEKVPTTKDEITGRQSQMIHLWSFLFLEQVAENEFDNAADPQFKQALANAEAQAAQQGKTLATQAAQQAAQAGKSYVPPPANIQDMVNDIASGSLSNKQLAAKGVTVQNWTAVMTLSFNAFRGVEKQLTSTSVQQASADANKARNDAIMNGAIVLGAVLLAGLISAMVARSMIRNMRRLRDGAQQIAQQRLPDLVRQLSKTDPGKVDLTVAPIQVSGKDEIAEVARAFDEVHSEAIRLAAEQAMLRGNVNAIFTNLSRRSHGLIERQLALITDLENNEADPDQLENLFKLDHLATRMRRNGENLLVLAGEDAGRTWGEPIPLVDVLRAAASEVEQYERVELAGIPETDVVGPAVTDLVHLLAELLENATTFSSPQTKVRVTATRLPDQRVLVEIHDKGIGLTADDFAEINAKLADPPTVDASVSRQMGLFVVGRLAERHDVRVQLRPSGESAGTTSLVMLPERLTQVGAVTQPEEEFTVSRIYPDSGQGGDAQGMRTASELGFDDSRYDRSLEPGDGSALDSVQRSLRLGQRRQQAALESGDPYAPGAPQAPAAEYGGFDGQPYGGGQNLGGQNLGGQNLGGQNLGGQNLSGQNLSGQNLSGQNFGQSAGGRDFDAEYRAEFGAQYGADSGGGYSRGYGAEAPTGHPQDLGQDRGHGRQSSGYPAQDGGYEAGRYTAQNFESGVAEQGGYGAEYGEDTYLTPGSTPGMQHYGTGSQGYEPGPAPTQGAQPSAGAPGGLPTRRPGAALGGNAIGARETGERPNWFTGAKESGQTTSAMPVMPPANGRPAAALPAAGPAGSAARETSDGGTTTAGLPRRVPRQNLLPGQIQDPDAAGNPDPTSSQPQLSRSPEEVRGRLTNLRRGIQQGHNAGDTPHQGSGPYGTNPQER
ncbi:sensor histidine kinase [Streptacidiphilus pinicola]|uniref:sensor histidine kinase n=1 Tax=Streptacidiphilus pinicola TaxID=2219663 RepID=UPI001FB471F2|nr:nitrate- and nitrite sensing domain-containing protein [Streptacidiphilus pinicola]